MKMRFMKSLLLNMMSRLSEQSLMTLTSMSLTSRTEIRLFYHCLTILMTVPLGVSKEKASHESVPAGSLSGEPLSNPYARDELPQYFHNCDVDVTTAAL